MTVRLAHLWSSDLGIPWSLPYCEPLVARGWEVTMICPTGPHAAGAEAAGLRFLPHRIPRRIDPRADAAGALELYRLIGRGRYDIVHTHNVKVGLVGRVVAALARAPIIVHTMHGLAYGMDTPPLARRVHALLERVASLRVDAVLSQTYEDMRTLLASGAIDRARVEWVGNGIRLDRFDPALLSQARAEVRAALGVGADDVLFLSAGRLVERKGFPDLFAAFAQARAGDARVRLAVAGPHDPGTEEALPGGVLEEARRAGVMLLGQRGDMERLYAAADAVVLASRWEGLPRTLMEGAAMARPLLCTDVRGSREVVRPGDTGLVVPAGDVEALAIRMRDLAADVSLRARMGEAARRDALMRFDVRRTVERVVAVYDRLLRAKGISAPPPPRPPA